MSFPHKNTSTEGEMKGAVNSSRKWKFMSQKLRGRFMKHKILQRRIFNAASERKKFAREV
jgi:hypothetical protein